MATFLSTTKEDYPKTPTRDNNLVVNTLRREFFPAIVTPYGDQAYLIRQNGTTQVFYHYGDPVIENTLVGELLPYKKQITFKEEDFDITTYLGITEIRNYTSLHDCPIARAFKRSFPIPNILVGVKYLIASPVDNPSLKKKVFFYFPKIGTCLALLSLYQRLMDSPDKEATAYLWGNLS